jgi:hypothetical protein
MVSRPMREQHRDLKPPDPDQGVEALGNGLPFKLTAPIALRDS